MKKIVLDVTALSDQYKNAGVGVYTRNVVKELIKSKKYSWHLVGYEDLKGRFTEANVSFHSLGKVRLSSPTNLLYFQKEVFPIVKEVEPELYFATNFERGLPIGLARTAVMIHDISPYLFNKFSAKGWIVNYLKGLFYKNRLDQAKRADLVLTNSNFTKKEIAKVGFDKQRVKVTQLAVSKKFSKYNKKKSEQDTILNKYSIKKPFILYYGGLERNKNIETLLEAFRSLSEKFDRLSLVLFDKDLTMKKGNIRASSTLAKRVKAKILNLDLEKKVVLPGIFEMKDISTILHESECFVHLSLYEGFGLAVLEALAAGAVVVASDKSSYPEVVGDAGLLVEPKNANEIVKTIVKIIESENLASKYRKKGPKRAEKYSWEKCGKKTLEAFDDLLAQ